MALGTGKMWNNPTGWGWGSNTGLSSLLSIFVPHFFGSGRASSGRGGEEVRTGQDIAKKKGHLLGERRATPQAV